MHLWYIAVMLTARAYRRVSRDRSGRERSIKEQDGDNQRAWPDFSWREPYGDALPASRHSNRRRTDFDRLMADLAGNHFGADVLVLWESSRGSRVVGEWVKLINLCEKHDVKIAVTTHGRIYDPANPRDRRTMLEDAIDSEYESAKTSLRVKRDVAASAVERRPHGKLLFGYRRERDPRNGKVAEQVPDPTQAPIVVGVYADFLAGASLRSIAERLNGEGVKTNRGNGWTPFMVRRMLSNPAYIGHRIHKGEDFGQGWEPIIDVDTFETAAVRLASISWRKVRKTSGLLGGVALCGKCHGKMYMKHSHRPYYGCVNYHAYRPADELDAWVTVAVLERLMLPDVGDALAGSEDPRAVEARRAVVSLRAELDEVVDLWRAKKLSAQSFAEMENHLMPQIRSAERVLRRAKLPLKIDVPEGAAVPAWWDELDQEIRREVTAALIAAVVVESTGRGRRHIDWSACTTIEWRH